jgi:hypothetical protein
VLEVPLGVDTDTATLAWVIRALEHARTQSQSKAVAYLEDVVDDVVFERDAKARRRGYT